MTEKIAEMLKYLQGNVTSEAYFTLEQVVRDIATGIEQDIYKREDLESVLIDIIQKIQLNDHWFIYVLSVLAKMFPKPVYVELLLEGSVYSQQLGAQGRSFILYQVKVMLFQMPQLKSDKTQTLFQQLYEVVKKELCQSISILQRDRKQRDEKKVIVMTSQILGERHAPTHSALERASMLKKMGYEVALISTMEENHISIVPFYARSIRNKIDDYDGVHLYNHFEEQFVFYQPEVPSSDSTGLQKIIACVQQLNPYFILYIGGQSFVGDILNEFCPVINVATVFSQLPGGDTAFSMVGRKVSDEERANSVSELIEVPFSFELTEKKRDYTRLELGIPVDKFVLVVVGNRLASDISDEFIEYIQKLDGIFLLCVGKFDDYEQKQERHSWLKENSVSLGWHDDVMGVLECADLYVNPRRLGGGFSVIEAFHAGIPAVSINYGDVAVAAGEEFCVETYDEMLDVIRKFQTDEVFYQEKLQLAKIRESEITDGFAGFSQGIQQILESDRFY